MEPASVHKTLTSLNEEEKIGYLYYRQFGRDLDYFSMRYLLQSEAFPVPEAFDSPNASGVTAPSRTEAPDFSVLDTDAARAARRQLLQSYGKDALDPLAERMIRPGYHAEVEHLPRYIDIPAHRHDFFEVVCVIEGSCLHTVESLTDEMIAGDITIIPPAVTHHLRALPECMALTVKIRKSTFETVFSGILRSETPLSEYFADVLYSSHYRTFLTFHCGDDPFVRNLFFCLYAEQQEEKPYACYVIDGLISTLFPYLMQNFGNTLEFAAGENTAEQRMPGILNEIRQNFPTATLQSVAKKFYLSAPYLSSLIQKQTGRTFSGILKTIRLEQAAHLLGTTDMKVAKVCETVGYKDTTQFIRTFRGRYGMTPKQYQRKLRGGN